MKILLEIDFSFDEIKDCSNEEVKSCLKEVLYDGSHCTNTDIEILSMQTEEDRDKYQKAIEYMAGQETRDTQAMINTIKSCKAYNKN